MRKDRSFDDIIKDKLNNVTPTYQPENWERLKERLDTAYSDETQDIEFFDRVVRQKTPATSNAGFSTNWTTLVNRLDIIYKRERDLAVSKLLELLALLLLFSVLDTQFASKSSEEDLYASDETTIPVLQPFAGHKMDEGSESNITSTRTIDFQIQGTASENIEQLQQAESTSHVDFTTPHPISSNYPNEAAFHQAPKYLIPSIGIQFPLPLETQWALPKLEPYAWLEIPELLPKGKSKSFYLGMFGSTDINSIHTPGIIEGPFSEQDRTTISIPALQRYALGYSGGASLGFGKGRWESEIGMVYTAKLYQARPVLYVTGSVSEGYSAEGLKDIELNMLAVPFQLKYNWLQQNGWRLYTSTGAALHVVLESNFLLADQDAFRSSSFNLSLPQAEPGSAPKSKGLHSKNLDGGLLQGGGFSNNAYLTGIISAGVERRFNNGWSIFMQPTYQHSLYYFSKGIGPDKDRIHTFSLMSGIRVRL